MSVSPRYQDPESVAKFARDALDDALANYRPHRAEVSIEPEFRDLPPTEDGYRQQERTGVVRVVFTLYGSEPAK